MVSFTHEQNSICSQKQLNDIAHEHTIICRQLFAGHVVGSQPMKRKKHLHQMMINFIIFVLSLFFVCLFANQQENKGQINQTLLGSCQMHLTGPLNKINLIWAGLERFILRSFVRSRLMPYKRPLASGFSWKTTNCKPENVI